MTALVLRLAKRWCAFAAIIAVDLAQGSGSRAAYLPLQEHQSGSVEVSAVDPVASMQAIDNPGLAEVTKEVQARLKRVVEDL
jgi:hypothetical protein